MITNKMEGPRAAAVRRDVLAARADQDVALASDQGADVALTYDYSQIDEAHRGPVMLSARRIKVKAERAKLDLIDVGEELAAVKARLPHGRFQDWIAGEFGMSYRTANRWMNVAEVWGKSDTVSLLSDSAMVELSGPSVPEAAREAAIVEAQATGKSPTKARVAEIIKDHETPTQQASRFDREAAARRADNDAKRHATPQTPRAAQDASERASSVIVHNAPETPQEPAKAPTVEPAMTSADRAKLRALIHDIFPLLYLAETDSGKFGKRATAAREELELLIGWLDD